MVTIRTADADDAPAVAMVHLRSAAAGLAPIFPAGTAAPPLSDLIDDWRGRIGPQRPPGQLGLVADAGAVVGVIIAGLDEDEPTIGQLSRLYVDPSHWRLGIGRRLFDAGLAYLRERGCAGARLWVLADNRRARAWYERMGWTATGERKPSCEGAVLSMPAGVEDVRYWLPFPGGGRPASAPVGVRTTAT
jgi:ribosomal protein S18 acetylase RimI-like enzyme